jgi:hypothetical protein
LIQNPDDGGTFANNGYLWAVENASWQAYNSKVSAFLSEIKSLNHAQPS